MNKWFIDILTRLCLQEFETSSRICCFLLKVKYSYLYSKTFKVRIDLCVMFYFAQSSHYHLYYDLFVTLKHWFQLIESKAEIDEMHFVYIQYVNFVSAVYHRLICNLTWNNEVNALYMIYREIFHLAYTPLWSLDSLHCLSLRSNYCFKMQKRVRRQTLNDLKYYNMYKCLESPTTPDRQISQWFIISFQDFFIL